MLHKRFIAFFSLTGRNRGLGRTGSGGPAIGGAHDLAGTARCVWGGRWRRGWRPQQQPLQQQPRLLLSIHLLLAFNACMHDMHCIVSLLTAGGAHQRQQAASIVASSAKDVAAAAAAEAKPPPLKAIPERIGFIGAGQMGEALIRGFLRVSGNQAAEGALPQWFAGSGASICYVYQVGCLHST